LTLGQYVHLPNGVPLRDGQSLRNMLYCSSGAASFAVFWWHWNPIWGYGLGKYVYSPLRRFLPSFAVIILTFIISSANHDLATMGVRRSFAFLFTPWVFLLGVGAVLSWIFTMDLSHRPWSVRASINLVYLVICFILPLLASRIAGPA
jgi:hypothetical protein